MAYFVNPIHSSIPRGEQSSHVARSVGLSPAQGPFDLLLMQTMHGDGPEVIEQKAADEAELEQVLRGFESFFIQYLLKCMRQATMRSGLFDTGFAMDTYESMLDEALAEEIAAAGGIGIGEMMMEQMREREWIG